jgi:hypothetical protein
LHCGFEGRFDESEPLLNEGAYADVSQFDLGNGGITVGRAMAISGAALSPYMGHHSSRPLAFLLTLFNLRLGWWLPNPWRTSTSVPAIRNRLLTLCRELLGQTTERAESIYVSDGGHFEGLGIYELVQRRCDLIIAIDSSRDPNIFSNAFGNAIEKCRVDFGAEIKAREIVLENGESIGLIGEVRYAQAGRPNGLLLLVKAVTTGNEPIDVLAYKEKHGDFPHESTRNQWFSEKQFESYRMLGEVNTDAAIRRVCEHLELSPARIDKQN